MADEKKESKTEDKPKPKAEDKPKHDKPKAEPKPETKHKEEPKQAKPEPKQEKAKEQPKAEPKAESKPTTGKEETVLQAIEAAKATGKIKKGANEVTKALERGVAKLVAVAKDVSPPEVIMHIPLIAKEKKIPCYEVSSKEELGAAAGLAVGTAAVAIIVEGDAKAIIKDLK